MTRWTQKHVAPAAVNNLICDYACGGCFSAMASYAAQIGKPEGLFLVAGSGWIPSQYAIQQSESGDVIQSERHGLVITEKTFDQWRDDPRWQRFMIRIALETGYRPGVIMSLHTLIQAVRVPHATTRLIVAGLCAEFATNGKFDPTHVNGARYTIQPVSVHGMLSVELSIEAFYKITGAPAWRIPELRLEVSRDENGIIQHRFDERKAEASQPAG